MAAVFHVELITPERHLLSAESTHVRAPGSAGDFGVLANHSPMVAGLGPGRLQIDFADNRKEEFAISGGYFTVENNKVIILAETCLRKSEIDLNKARADKQAAQQRIDAAATPAERDEARASLDRANALILVADHKGD
ncbi:MAG: ATP synthase F1 subunit epsilon [Calditrichaeota bacterium]|nr:ATP synthase F1 subunit epsilon [Calditrichota bacterium]MCB9391598.1 ATP synthase F1 subunit epsilon [Calditrichota bacterium]